MEPVLEPAGQLYPTVSDVRCGPSSWRTVEERKLRQEIGETFISWADEYFSAPEHIGCRLVKKELFDALCLYDPAQRKYNTPASFKKKFVMYCKWKGFVFNPQKYDSRPIPYQSIRTDVLSWMTSPAEWSISRSVPARRSYNREKIPWILIFREI